MWLTRISVKTSALGKIDHILLFKSILFSCQFMAWHPFLWVFPVRSETGSHASLVWFYFSNYHRVNNDEQHPSKCFAFICAYFTVSEKREKSNPNRKYREHDYLWHICKEFHTAETYPQAPCCSSNTNKKYIKYLIKQLVGFYSKKSISHHITMQILL